MPKGVYKRTKIKQLEIKKEDRYEKLTVIREVDPHFTHGRRRVRKILCKCDCGSKRIVSLWDLRSGSCRACRRCQLKHGMYGTSTYRSWISMKRRCSLKDKDHVKWYGEKGIIVCERWLEFENFYADMGERPEGKTLDRIDNNKGYYNENCRWSTVKEQNNNKSDNKFITYNGITLTQSQWADKLNIKSHNIKNRFNQGWSIERTLTEPIRYKK